MRPGASPQGDFRLLQQQSMALIEDTPALSNEIFPRCNG